MIVIFSTNALSLWSGLRLLAPTVYNYNTNIYKIHKRRRAIFSAIYILSPPNLAILPIL